VKPSDKREKNIKPQRGERKRSFILAGTFTFLGMHFVFSTKNMVLNTMKIIYGNNVMSFRPFGAYFSVIFNFRGRHPQLYSYDLSGLKTVGRLGDACPEFAKGKAHPTQNKGIDGFAPLNPSYTYFFSKDF